VPDLAGLAHRNLCDFTRFLGRLEQGAFLDERGAVANAGPTDFPSSRTAIRADCSLAATDWADLVTGFFDAHGKSAMVYARVGADDDLIAVLDTRGFRNWSQTPEMICGQRPERRVVPDGITLRFANTAEDFAAYAEIAGRAFTHIAMPAELTSATMNNPEVMLGSDCVIALADVDGTPVAGAMIVLFGPEPLAYVGWVSCIDEARGRGLGDVVTRRVTNEAFDRGAQLVTLEATQFGQNTYARMGYREIYRYAMLIRI